MNPDLDVGDEFLDDEPRAGSAQADNPLKWVHRSLRGRYHWAILLGVVLMIPCAIIGYFVLPPTYQSTGLVQVTPTIPVLVHNTPESSVPPMFQSYVNTLGQLMKTRRVLDKAVDDDRMRQVGWPRGIEGVAALESRTSVGTARTAHVISVMVEDRDPLRAQVAVNALLDAFLTIHGEQFGLGVTEKEQRLNALVQSRQREIDTIKTRILRIAQKYGTDDLSRLHEAELEKLRRIEDEITVLSINAEALQNRRSASDDASTGDDTVEQLAQVDRELGDLLKQRRDRERDLDVAINRLGPNHRTTRDIRKRIEADQRQIDDRVEALRVQLAGGSTGAALGGAMTQLKARLDQLKALRQITADQVRDIGADKVAIALHKEEERAKKSSLAEIQKQLEELTVEKSNLMEGRVTVVQKGEFPVAPSNDRRKALAGAGAAGGFAMGIGIVGFLGFLRRGYRYLDELTDLTGAATLLGTLPELNAPSDEDNQLAALAIHHVRNMLHVLSPAQPGRGRLFAVTSASAGEGKTSLTHALGMSFAVAGQRTIIVDADLIGRGLTAQLGLDNAPGLAEATEASDLSHCIHATASPGLSAMPAGAIPGFDPERLSEADIERLGRKLRERFDTIIIDTGPILGSLEADIACSQADRVVMAISRGQAPRLVQASLARLKHLGVRSVGLVFNRATPQDMTKSISHVSIHAESLRQPPEGSAERARRRIAPLARAVSGKEQLPQHALNGATSGARAAHEDQPGVAQVQTSKDGDQASW